MQTAHSIPAAVVLATALAASLPAEPLVPESGPPAAVSLEVSGEIFRKDATALAKDGLFRRDLILGFTTPITCQWGPVDVFWGENPWEPGSAKQMTRAAYRLLPPDGVVRRIELIKSLNESLRKQKVAGISPTFAFSTLVGDHGKRLGFWEFYDRWGHYTKWAGPRPWNDPFDWLCVDREGNPILADNPGVSPHETGFQRYRCCIHHTDWEKFQGTVMLSCGEIGYSGALADDVAPVPCFCRHCRRQFRAFLDDSSHPDWVDRLCNGKKLADLSLESPETPPEVIRRWRLLSTAVYLEALRTAGKTSTEGGFGITAGGLRLADAAEIGESVDWLLFTDAAAPGIRTTGTIPNNNNLTVGVVEGAAKPEYFSYVFRIRHPGTNAVLRAKIRLPAVSRTGETLPVNVAISLPPTPKEEEGRVGDFHLLFTDVKTSEGTKVPLKVADSSEPSKPAERGEPATIAWTGTWSPKTPGTYEVSFGFTHHSGDGQTAEDVPYQARLRWPRICRSHQAELLFAQQMKAKPLFVGKDWFALRSPASVRALALAEMAAFGGGGGWIVPSDAPQEGPLESMWEFVSANSPLFEGWRLDGPIGVLYAAWGPNPVSVRTNEPFSQVTDRLETERRPYVALIDQNLPTAAGSLGRLKVICLVSPRYDLSAAQIQALRGYVAGGGQVVTSSEQTQINGEPVQAVLGPKVEAWGPRKKVFPGKPTVADGAGVENVRVARYERENQLALHLVNYNVCLLDPQGRAIPLRDLTVNVELPPGWRGLRATVFAPGAAPVSLPTKVEAGLGVFELPSLDIYSILLLEPAAEN